MKIFPKIFISIKNISDLVAKNQQLEEIKAELKEETKQSDSLLAESNEDTRKILDNNE